MISKITNNNEIHTVTSASSFLGFDACLAFLRSLASLYSRLSDMVHFHYSPLADVIAVVKISKHACQTHRESNVCQQVSRLQYHVCGGGVDLYRETE